MNREYQKIEAGYRLLKDFYEMQIEVKPRQGAFLATLGPTWESADRLCKKDKDALQALWTIHLTK